MPIRRDSKGRFAGGGGSSGGKTRASRPARKKVKGARKANASVHASRKAFATPQNRGSRSSSRVSLRSRALRKSRAAPVFTAYKRNTAKRSKKR